MNSPHDFGPRLKATRERRGITLEAIADTTKIGAPLLAALERNDVSHWPQGIYRRAFLRDYAAAIGAPVDDTLAEFLRLFPDAGAPAGLTDAPAGLRMTLEPTRPYARRRGLRVAAALAEALLVVLLGLAAAWLLGADHSNGVAVAVLLYYPLTTAWFGRSVALSWLQDGTLTPDRRRAALSSMPRAGAMAAGSSAESAREDWLAAGAQRDRRTGIDRRRVPRVLGERDAASIAGLFRVGKGSAA